LNGWSAPPRGCRRWTEGAIGMHVAFMGPAQNGLVQARHDAVSLTLPPATEARPAPPRAGWLGRKRETLWAVFNDVQRLAIVPQRWRMALLRRAGCRLAPGAEVREDVFVGANTLAMGVGSYLNRGCFLDGSAPISIGDHVRIGPCVKMLTGTHSYQHDVIRRGPRSTDIRRPITIERGCWIGIGTVILPGVTVAEGCVIAAGSVLVSSTTPNGLYAGNPARRMRDLPTG
jgi:acetyltransferase-like isoleucine patch superfamily enzyme